MITAIIVPTYNEAENVTKLVPAIEKALLAGQVTEYFLVFVDGKSTDKTFEILTAFAKKNPKIHVLSEKEKLGLGSAYTMGMRYAIDQLKADILVEMDADFQHDPNDLPRLIGGVLEGADYVIGSRYVKGGSIPKEWAFYRKLLSFGGNLFSRIVLWLPNVNDVTSGFRASRALFVNKLALESFEKRGYMYKIRLLFEMHKLGARIKEIPIRFGLRDRGDSKMGFVNISGSLLLVLKLRAHESSSFIKFLVVGIAGLVVQTTILFLLSFEFHIDPKVGLIPAFVSAVFTTFTLNNLWSFRHQKIVVLKDKLAKFGQFILINIVSFIIQRSALWVSQLIFNHSLSHTLFIGYPSGILIGLVWNYLCYSRIIWSRKKS